MRRQFLAQCPVIHVDMKIRQVCPFWPYLFNPAKSTFQVRMAWVRRVAQSVKHKDLCSLQPFQALFREVMKIITIGKRPDPEAKAYYPAMKLLDRFKLQGPAWTID